MGPAKKGRPKLSANPSGPLHTVSPNRSNPSIAMTQMGGEAIRNSDSLPRPEGSGQRADHMESKDFREKTGKRQFDLRWYSRDRPGGKSEGKSNLAVAVVPQYGLPGKLARPTTNYIHQATRANIFTIYNLQSNEFGRRTTAPEINSSICQMWHRPQSD